MNIRPTQAANFDLVRAGLNFDLAKLVQIQQQVSSGKRISKPSDDPVGASQSLALAQRLGDIGRHTSAITAGKPLLEQGMSSLDEAGQILAQVQQLVVQASNGTLNDNDRASIGDQIASLRTQLLEIANTRLGDRALFGGTETSGDPFVAAGSKIEYRGNDVSRTIEIGQGAEIAFGLPGSDVFAKSDASGTTYAGLTGAKHGVSADEGQGYANLIVRHDATAATLGSGLSLVANGAQDTFLGDRSLAVDAASGTVKLGNGAPVLIPTGAAASNVVVKDEHDAEIHLDFSGFTNTNYNGVVNGSGSMSLDGTNFVAIDFNANDVQVQDSAAGQTVHVDATAIKRAGSDLVTFGGTANVFDVLQGIADDLKNTSGLSADDVRQRVNARIPELDRNTENVASGLSTLGARSQRVTAHTSHLADLDLTLKSLKSDVEDVDLSSAILEMTRTEQTLQLAQATGTRLMQNTLLNYLK